MAKQVKVEEKKDYPSKYGSHKSMVVGKIMEGVGADLNIPSDRQVALKDENGIYITDVNVLDNGMADPNRYGNIKARISVNQIEKPELPKPAEVVA